MTDPSPARWWVTRHHHDGEDEHLNDTCDHRYFVHELNIGWQFWSPAGRLETVTNWEPTDGGGYFRRIWTDKTGDAWSWRRRSDDRVHAIPGESDAVKPYLAFVDLGGSVSGRASMHIVPTSLADVLPDFSLTLVEAHHLGPHQGWQVTDRPDGGDTVVTTHTGKAAARTALLAAGRRHAKQLGLKIYKERP